MARRQRRGMTPARAERAAKVVTLYDGGATFEQIARTLGVSRTVIREDYEKAMEEARPDVARNIFAKTDRRLNKLHAAWWKKALDGDIKAARLILGINKQMADLWGINGAVKLDIEINGGEEFADLLDQVRNVALSDDGE
ncbi:hypothetical protein I2443_07180 [Corynebacterium phoceense]|nr:hypothetical protein [Corynebacterium phoceense]